MTTKRLGACTYCGLKATVKPNGTAYCSRCRRFTPRLLDPIRFEVSEPLTDSRGPAQESSIDGPFPAGTRDALYTSSHTTSTRN
jgi:hypothetical protein